MAVATPDPAPAPAPPSLSPTHLDASRSVGDDSLSVASLRSEASASRLAASGIMMATAAASVSGGGGGAGGGGAAAAAVPPPAHAAAAPAPVAGRMSTFDRLAKVPQRRQNMPVVGRLSASAVFASHGAASRATQLGAPPSTASLRPYAPVGGGAAPRLSRSFVAAPPPLPRAGVLSTVTNTAPPVAGDGIGSVVPAVHDKNLLTALAAAITYADMMLRDGASSHIVAVASPTLKLTSPHPLTSTTTQLQWCRQRG